MRQRPAAPAALLVLAGLVAACAGPAATPGPPAASPTTGGPTPASASPPAATSPTPAAPIEPGQTDTEWGRIWDALPRDFPPPQLSASFVAVEPDVAASGAVETPVPADEVATAFQGALELASFSTESMSGPFEDGSWVIESVGPASTACRVQTTIEPRGGLTRVTIRYGAACPSPAG